jgi:WD40 repeat protein
MAVGFPVCVEQSRSRAKTLKVNDVATGDIVQELQHQNSSGLVGVWNVVFSLTDGFLGTWGFITPITIWDLSSGEKKYELPGETMAFDSDGSLIATSVRRFRSGVWISDTATGESKMDDEAALVAQQVA